MIYLYIFLNYHGRIGKSDTEPTEADQALAEAGELIILRCSSESDIALESFVADLFDWEDIEEAVLTHPSEGEQTHNIRE